MFNIMHTYPTLLSTNVCTSSKSVSGIIYLTLSYCQWYKNFAESACPRHIHQILQMINTNLSIINVFPQQNRDLKCMSPCTKKSNSNLSSSSLLKKYVASCNVCEGPKISRQLSKSQKQYMLQTFQHDQCSSVRIH